MIPQFWIVLGIMIYGSTMYIDIVTDYKRIEDGRGVNHTRGLIIRCLGLIPSWICIGWLPFDWNWRIAVSFLGIMGSVYWMLFDGFLANKRRYNWWATGSSADSDRFLSSFTTFGVKCIKIGLVIITGVWIGIIIHFNT